MIFRFSVTSLLNGSSTTTAPVVSKRPRSTTLVMPPARSSTDMSMQHLSHPCQRCHSGIRFAAECQTWPVQEISERFSAEEPAARGTLMSRLPAHSGESRNPGETESHPLPRGRADHGDSLWF